MKLSLLLDSISKRSDNQLLRRLSELLQNSRRVEAELVAHIAEVMKRRLYARYASSMYKYCTEVLHLAEYEAYLRIGVAKASLEHPVLLEMLADGRLHLTGISILHPHLTKANRRSLLKRATHKSKQEILELVAEIAPKKDVPATMRKLPDRLDKTKSVSKNQLGPDQVDSSNMFTGNDMRESKTPFSKAPVPASTKPAAMTPLAPARYKV
jgi:hypothetical protein